MHEVVPGDPPRGYTTILKLMQIMADKGLVVRDKQQRAHVHEAAAARAETQQRLVTNLGDKAFAGSASGLVMRALSSQGASKAGLAEIRRLIDEMEQE